MIEIEYVHTVSEMEQNNDSQLSSTFESDIILAGIQVPISSWRLHTCYTGIRIVLHWQLSSPAKFRWVIVDFKGIN
jgi:hypothetical protein